MIVHDLGLTTSDGRAVWQGHDETHAVTPRVLVQGLGDNVPRAKPGRQAIPSPLTEKGLIDAVAAAMDGRIGRGRLQVSPSRPQA